MQTQTNPSWAELLTGLEPEAQAATRPAPGEGSLVIRGYLIGSGSPDERSLGNGLAEIAWRRGRDR